MTVQVRPLVSSALAGAASGARSFTGLAGLTLATSGGAEGQPDRTLGRPWVKAVAGLAAATEIGLDKLPNAPSRRPRPAWPAGWPERPPRGSSSPAARHRTTAWLVSPTRAERWRRIPRPNRTHRPVPLS